MSSNEALKINPKQEGQTEHALRVNGNRRLSSVPIRVMPRLDFLPYRVGAKRKRPDKVIDSRGEVEETSIRHFFDNLGDVLLLTAVQEIELAKWIEAGAWAKLQLNGDKQQPKENESLTESQILLQNLSHDGDIAKKYMIHANVLLVVAIAKKYAGQGLPLLDLIQEGVIGLTRAVEKFDYHKGFKFSTYATWWVEQACAKALADKSRNIRWPVHVVKRQRKVYNAARNLESSLGRPPTNEELADETGISLEQVAEVKSLVDASVSLNLALGEDGESEFADLIPDDTAVDAYESAKDAERRRIIRRALASNHLSDKERTVLSVRYGFEGEGATLEEVGTKIGLTKTRVHQIETDSLEKLASLSEIQAMKEDYTSTKKPPIDPATGEIAKLSDREKRVIERLYDGLSVRMIAEAENIQRSTVYGIKKSAYKKLGTTTIEQAFDALVTLLDYEEFQGEEL